MASFLSETNKVVKSCSVDWYESNVCYEDSEGDLNAISDDEDLQNAHQYC